MVADLPVLARPFLPRGKGALILILGGIGMLMFAFLAVMTLDNRRVRFSEVNGKKPPSVARAGPFRIIWGAVAGAVCAFFTYWAGGAFAASQDLMAMPPEQVPYEFLRPFTTFTVWEGVFVLAGTVLGGMLARYRWRMAGLLSYVALIAVMVGYVVYSVTVSLPQVPDEQKWISMTLLTAEAAGLGLIVIFSFYSLDVATRRHWTRAAPQRPFHRDHRPAVAAVVPTFNEPVDLVQETIRHLTEQDYDKRKLYVILADDSTDPTTRQELEAYCKQVGASYVHREDRRGFKAGALNHVTRLLPREVELIAVVDADYWVKPHYISSVAGYFVDPELGFVQSPQDYRNGDQSFLTRQYQRAEAFFYHGIMHSRNEEDDIIFCGTMGVLRRRALEEIGGFAEDQICEDAEVSIRLNAGEWGSLYIDKSFGKGLMPAVFEQYKKQFHRWAFGNVRILTSRFWTIMRSPMRKRQKLDFVASNLHWFDGLFVFTIAATLLYLGLGPLLGYDAVTHHQREIMLIGLVPVFLLVDGIVRVHMVLRRAGGISFRQTILVQGMWFAIKWTNLTAAMKALMGFNAPFVRTPKDPGKRLNPVHAFFRSVRIAPFESIMGAGLATVAAYHLVPGLAPAGVEQQPLLAVWLAMYSLFFLTAPIYAYLAYRTLKPESECVDVATAHQERRRARRSVRA